MIISGLNFVLHRNDHESHLKFLGLVALKNIVRIGSASTIEELKEANIKCVMVTGMIIIETY